MCSKLTCRKSTSVLEPNYHEELNPHEPATIMVLLGEFYGYKDVKKGGTTTKK
jgi:hypothetical protein